jgi:hypothetical protein
MAVAPLFSLDGAGLAEGTCRPNARNRLLAIRAVSSNIVEDLPAPVLPRMTTCWESAAMGRGVIGKVIRVSSLLLDASTLSSVVGSGLGRRAVPE